VNSVCQLGLGQSSLGRKLLDAARRRTKYRGPSSRPRLLVARLLKDESFCVATYGALFNLFSHPPFRLRMRSPLGWANFATRFRRWAIGFFTFCRSHDSSLYRCKSGGWLTRGCSGADPSPAPLRLSGRRWQRKQKGNCSGPANGAGFGMASREGGSLEKRCIQGRRASIENRSLGCRSSRR
jgi:hypothetical protein